MPPSRANGVTAGLLCVSLAACGGEGASASAAGAASSTASTPAPSAAAPSPAPASPANETPPKPAASTDPFASTLTVYAIHAPRSQLNPKGLVWTSPGDLTRQVLLNEAGAAVLDFKHTIGHASVKLECAATGTTPARRFVGGMTNGNDADLRDLVLKTGVGLGIMFEAVSGRLQKEAEIDADIAEGIKNGGTNFVRYGLSPAVCHKLVDYAAAYQAAGLDKVYGLAVRPLAKEGAGCSAFAVSFLELANLLDARFRAEWSFKVRVPKFTQPWVGTPEPIVGGSRNPGVVVPVSRVASLTRPWADAAEEGFDSAGWDPTQMNESIDKVIDETLALGAAGAARVEVSGKLRGLRIDATQIVPTAALTQGAYFSP